MNTFLSLILTLYKIDLYKNKELRALQTVDLTKEECFYYTFLLYLEENRAEFKTLGNLLYYNGFTCDDLSAKDLKECTLFCNKIRCLMWIVAELTENINKKLYCEKSAEYKKIIDEAIYPTMPTIDEERKSVPPKFDDFLERLGILLDFYQNENSPFLFLIRRDFLLAIKPPLALNVSRRLNRADGWENIDNTVNDYIIEVSKIMIERVLKNKIDDCREYAKELFGIYDKAMKYKVIYGLGLITEEERIEKRNFIIKETFRKYGVRLDD